MRRFAIAIADANVIIAYGEGYDRGADVVHQELRNWRPGQHGPECICDYFVTGHVLRDKFFHEVIEIINEAAAQHRLKGHAGLE